MTPTKPDTQRAFEFTLDIDASAGEVWRALTDAEELMRWFPLEAQVTPGAGGAMRWSWEEHHEWTTRIDAWEPGRLLRLVQDDYRPADDVEPAQVVMEFTLETHRGKTRLRLVHSGFGRGAAWDNELDGISEGWPSELGSLRYYLEHHRGRERHVGRATASVAAPREAVWTKLIGPDCFRVSPAALEVGSPIEVTLPGGERLSGTVETFLPERSVSGIMREMGGALFRVGTWRDPQGKTGVWIWLASYASDARPALERFQRDARLALQRLFPAAAASNAGSTRDGS